MKSNYYINQWAQFINESNVGNVINGDDYQNSEMYQYEGSPEMDILLNFFYEGGISDQENDEATSLFFTPDIPNSKFAKFLVSQGYEMYKTSAPESNSPNDDTQEGWAFSKTIREGIFTGEVHSSFCEFRLYNIPRTRPSDAYRDFDDGKLDMMFTILQKFLKLPQIGYSKLVKILDARQDHMDLIS